MIMSVTLNLPYSPWLQVETSGNYIIQNEDYLTKFTITEAERRHTGIYKINAKNDSGSDEADLEIVVLGEYVVLHIQ